MPIEAFPLVVGWELTLTCNLRCLHCGSSAGSPRKNELTTREALNICDQFPDLLVQEVDFTGGEPLLRSDWKKLAERLAKHGINVSILTHGLDLNREKIQEMKKIDISCIGISIDGLEPNHDYIRGKIGAFKKSLQTINLLNQADLKCNVITTVSSQNVSDLSELLCTLLSNNVNFWRLQPLIPIGRAIDTKALYLESQAVIQLGEFIKENKEKAHRHGLEIINADGLQYIFEEEKHQTSKMWRGCPAGWSTCGITSDGKIKGCLSMPDELIEGDLRKNDLWDIWFDNDTFPYNRKYLTGQIGPNCIDCDMIELCKGGCSVNSYQATGKFHNDPYCFYILNKKQN
jgi:radical SAM protein with 4Fe4S-binding SPASM domain